MSIVQYVLSKAKKENPLDTTNSYIKQRKEIYEKLKQNNNPQEFFNNKNFKQLEKKYKELANLPKELANVKITSPTSNYLFEGENDAQKIQQLINKLKSLQDVENFNQYTELFNELESTNKYIREDIRGKFNSNNIFSISTKDYELMKKAILQAQNENNIKVAKDAAKKYYSGLIGNLGESIGIIQGYNLLSKEIKQQLKNIGIEIQVSNVGGEVKGKRSVGDTMVSFVANDNQIIGTISLSNKLSANYQNSKATRIKLRTTFPNQIPNQRARSLYYNLFSLHAKGNEKELDLYPNRQNEIFAFRRYVAALILQENLFGAFQGDNVYYFNYGEYLYTMNDLLTYWISSNIKESEIPSASLPGHEKRLNIMKYAKSQEQADKIIAQQQLIITYNFHIGNLNAAL